MKTEFFVLSGTWPFMNVVETFENKADAEKYAALMGRTKKKKMAVVAFTSEYDGSI